MGSPGKGVIRGAAMGQKQRAGKISQIMKMYTKIH